MTRAACGLPEQALVLCAFNQTYKFTAAVFDVWCDALLAAPNALLWVLKYNPLAVEHMANAMRARGLSAERLVAGPLLPLDRHLARLACADLFVDTYPCNAHTTASDALWVGVPVLTRSGRTFASRVAASLLAAVGMPEMVTESSDAYRERLLDLVRRPDALGALKARLRAARDRVPLFDSERYTRNLERAFESMWDRHQRGLPPDHIVVAEPAA